MRWQTLKNSKSCTAFSQVWVSMQTAFFPCARSLCMRTQRQHKSKKCAFPELFWSRLAISVHILLTWDYRTEALVTSFNLTENIHQRQCKYRQFRITHLFSEFHLNSSASFFFSDFVRGSPFKPIPTSLSGTHKKFLVGILFAVRFYPKA